MPDMAYGVAPDRATDATAGAEHARRCALVRPDVAALLRFSPLVLTVIPSTEVIKLAAKLVR